MSLKHIRYFFYDLLVRRKKEREKILVNLHFFADKFD